MARYKPYDYSQLMMIAVSLEDQLVPGTLEHTIHYLVEERLDLKCFDAEYKNDDAGCRAYDPRILLKVVLLGYAWRMQSSRSLERACRTITVFMALTCGQQPDHSTFASFVSGMGKERVESLFTQVLMVCEEEGLLGGTHFSLDGLKLSSNASKEWSGTHSDLRKKKEKIERLVKDAMAEHRRNDQRGKEREQERKRIDRLKARAERIERFLAENKPRVGRRKQEIQSNITDPDSAKMKTSHGIVQGYNAHAMVDGKHQIVVRAEAMGEGGDSAAIEPMLEGAKVNLEAAGCDAAVLTKAVLSADTGYYSQENLEACAEAGVDAYIPDPKFRKRDPRFSDAARHRRPTDKRKRKPVSDKTRFQVKDFRHDKERGCLICPAGQKLHKDGMNGTSDGYRVNSYKGLKTVCGSCKLRTKCLRNPNQESPRQVRIFGERGTDDLTGAMRHKIDTVEGRRIYSRRLGNVEPVFANIRTQKRMDRFTLRGQAKVNVQWKLYCLVHNVEKLGGYGYAFSGN